MSDIGTICNFISVFMVQQSNPKRQQKCLLFFFSERNINFVGYLFKTDDALKPWKQLQEEYFLQTEI